MTFVASGLKIRSASVPDIQKMSVSKATGYIVFFVMKIPSKCLKENRRDKTNEIRAVVAKMMIRVCFNIAIMITTSLISTFERIFPQN